MSRLVGGWMDGWREGGHGMAWHGCKQLREGEGCDSIHQHRLDHF